MDRNWICLPSFPDQEALRNAYGRTIVVCGRNDRDAMSEEECRIGLAALCGTRDWASGTPASRSGPSKPGAHGEDFGFLEWSQASSQYAAAIDSGARGRKLCVTKNDRLGLCLAETCAGDIVAVLIGAAVPFIMHRYEDFSYKLVGDTYIYGLMNGEALESQEGRVQEFIIG
jgi:hypothetical protein